MKRSVTAATLLALVALFAASRASAGIGVRVSGALSYVSYGDFNDFVASINDEVLAANGAEGTIDAIHWVPEFAGEIVVSVAPALELGIGGGFISGTSAFSFSVSGAHFDYEHTVKAYPVTATAYFELPVLPFAKPYAFAGVGAYYTKLTFDETAVSGGTTEGLSAELTKWGYGLHGGAGLSFAVAPAVSVDFGVKARWARIKGFTGTATSLDGVTTGVFLASYPDKEDGLVFGPESTADAGTYGEGSVDLSGFAFTLAVRVSF